MDVITESELAKHYEVHNLWVSIRGKVYDVSSYVDDHPGGVEVLKDVGGSDGTESFEYVGHSEDAYKTLAKFQVGVLEGETDPAAQIPSQAWDVQRSPLQSASMKSKMAGWPVAVTLLLAAGIVSRWLLRNQQAYEKTAFVFVWQVSSPFWTGVVLATLASMSVYMYLYARFTKTLEYYKEVWQYPSYFSCKANRYLEFTIIINSTMHTYFLGLSLVGYDALWGRMIRSGVAGSVGSVKRTGTFPNGDALRTSFTGIPGFDQFLVPAVIFYNNILGNGSSADRMLLISLFTTMQTVSHCMLVLAWDRGKRPPWAILEHLSWGVFNQAWGAAAVYPLYCFTHVERFLVNAHSSKASEKSDVGPSDSTEAFALIPTAILGAITPAMLLYPAFSPLCSINQRQGLIAFYRFTPLALAIAHPACCWAERKFSEYLAWKPAPSRAKAYTIASLMLSGFAAAAGHLWALVGPSEGGLRRVFWPAEYIDKNSTTTIADGARDFLQWDIFVITAALVPFADQVLKSSPLLQRLKSRKWFSTAMESFIGRMTMLTVASGIFSPGAVLAFSLAMNLAS